MIIAIFTILSFCVGLLLGHVIADGKWADAVKNRGLAHFNGYTGKLVWKDDGKEVP